MILVFLGFDIIWTCEFLDEYEYTDVSLKQIGEKPPLFSKKMMK